MKTIQPYHITEQPFIVRDGLATMPILRVRDKPSSPSLAHLFEDSHSLFRQRVRNLGRLSSTTTEEDAESMRLMLEVLIETKHLIQKTSS